MKPSGKPGTYSLYVKSGTQFWCVTLKDGSRYAGEFFPYTDPILKSILDSIGDNYIIEWIQRTLREKGILDNDEPVMAYLAVGCAAKRIATEPMLRIGNTLQKLVERYCSK